MSVNDLINFWSKQFLKDGLAAILNLSNFVIQYCAIETDLGKGKWNERESEFTFPGEIHFYGSHWRNQGN